jgi:hypothetical protein
VRALRNQQGTRERVRVRAMNHEDLKPRKRAPRRVVVDIDRATAMRAELYLRALEVLTTPRALVRQEIIAHIFQTPIATIQEDAKKHLEPLKARHHCLGCICAACGG